MSFVEKKLQERTVYEGKVFTVRTATVELPDGNQATRDSIEHHGGAAILPLDNEGNIYLVRQYRFGIGRALLEIPAGKLEPGEDPKETACRELTEEIGFKPGKLVSLGHMELSPAYLSEIIHLYLARDLIPCEAPRDEDEFIEVVKMPFAEALEQVLNNTLTDAKTQATILKAAMILNNK